LKERAEFQSGLLTGYNDLRKEVIGDCVLYHGDCAVILPQLQDFDLILTDPPYGINEAAGKNMSRGGMAVAQDYGVDDWDREPPPFWLFLLMAEKGKNSIFWGGNYFGLPASPCWLVWDKNNGSNDFADCELAWTNLAKAVRMKKYTWKGMLQENMKQKEKRVHPTQKPVPIMEWCLSHAPDAKTVCDPFMGSGTTGVACARKGLEFTGIEREAKYFDIACERIATAYRTRPRLFDSVKPSKPVQQVLF
jgi:DNA modification methylase